MYLQKMTTGNKINLNKNYFILNKEAIVLKNNIILTTFTANKKLMRMLSIIKKMILLSKFKIAALKISKNQILNRCRVSNYYKNNLLFG